MGGKYKAYPEYRDSGVEWVGEIPSGWNLARLKYVSELKGKKVSGKTDDRYVGMENVESKTGRYIATTEPEELGVSDEFSEGDVLFGKLRPYLAKSWLATFSGVCSSEFLVLRSRKISPAFLNYYTLIEEFINQVNGSTYGSKMPRANWDFIGLMDVPTPDYEQSQKIARFLDHETGKIDLLIEKQQELIALLKEKRQAVISHAVTKGLTPQAPLKDSGIEWLGQVPEHWNAGKTKFFADLRTGHTPSRSKPEYWKDCNIPWFSLADVWQIRDAKNIYLNTTKERISERGLQNSAAELLPAGTVILSRTASVGFSGIMPKPMATTQDFVNWIPRQKLTSEYLLFVFRAMERVFESLKVGSTHKTIYMPDVLSFTTPVPPHDEQVRIVAFIKKSLEKLDKSFELAETQITFLQERRTALISAAVTGKIDVRDWEPPESKEP